MIFFEVEKETFSGILGRNVVFWKIYFLKTSYFWNYAEKGTVNIDGKLVSFIEHGGFNPELTGREKCLHEWNFFGAGLSLTAEITMYDDIVDFAESLWIHESEA